MITKQSITTGLLAVGLALACGQASAQDASKKPHVPLERTIGQPKATAPIPSLAVLNSLGAKLEGGKLILTGVAPNAIVFADRPVRAAGHVTTKQFIMQWDEGKDNFAVDPPNATVSVIGGDGSEISDAVVVLKTPKLDGSTLTFDVSVLEGSIANANGPAALFIDAFAVRGPYGGGAVHVGGYGGAWRGGAYWHAPVYHGAWYGAGAVAAGAAVGAAAVGAAAAAPYYHPYAPYAPACGYYPYPPCY